MDCRAKDVVMEYSFGRSDNCLEAKDFSPQYYYAILALGPSTALIKQMYWLYQLMRSLPSSIVGRLSSNLHTVLQMQKVTFALTSYHHSLFYFYFYIAPRGGGGFQNSKKGFLNVS